VLEPLVLEPLVLEPLVLEPLVFLYHHQTMFLDHTMLR
jgi:hypothetical protein